MTEAFIRHSESPSEEDPHQGIRFFDITAGDDLVLSMSFRTASDAFPQFTFAIPSSPSLEQFLEIAQRTKSSLEKIPHLPTRLNRYIVMEGLGKVTKFLNPGNDPLTDWKFLIEKTNPGRIIIYDTPADFHVDFQRGITSIISPLCDPETIGIATAELNPRVTAGEISTEITQILTHS